MSDLTIPNRKNTTPKVVLSDKLKYMLMNLSLIAVHTSLIFLFYFMGVRPMFLFNIGSVTLYLFSLILTLREHYFTFFILTYVEIILHSFMATLFVSWEFGFPLYIIVLPPSGYYVFYTLKTSTRKVVLPTILALISFCSFIGCRILSNHITYVYESNQTLETIIYALNTVCAYSFLIFFCITFILETHHFTQKLETQANVDPLTGLFNRRFAHTYMKEIVQKEEPFHIMMCDIDNFKITNDTYGHDFGDVVLKRVAGIIQKAVDECGVAFRWGGEELLVLCNIPEADKAHELAQKIRRNLEEYRFDFNGHPVHSTITIGVYKYNPGDNITKAISAADKNLYIGKERGRNIVIM